MPAHKDDFEAVVVGSGFGGSVVAYRLAKAGLSVCVLERGKRYGPGDFARTPREMSRNFWDPSQGLQGLFDIWSFKHIEAVVSAGLGGGSLIYANVLLRKPEHWFHDRGSPWPVTRDDLDPHYAAVEALIGTERYPFDRSPYNRTPKTIAFREAVTELGLDPLLPPLAVAFSPDSPGEPIKDALPNVHGSPRYTCRLVGECDIGCNFGAKNSLDYTYLSRAALDHDAVIRTRCEVKTFSRRHGGGFTVSYVEHDDDHEGRPTDTSRLARHEITAERLILSAGTLGTPFLLFRNREGLGDLSDALGSRFCGNGDLLGFATKAHDARGGKDDTRDLAPSFGPVITSAIRVADSADGGAGPGYYIEDGGYPGFAGWMQETLDLPGEVVRAAQFVVGRLWDAARRRPDSNISAELSRLLGTTWRSASTLTLLGMGRDTPDGQMKLNGKRLEIDWSIKTSEAYFDRVRKTMHAMADKLDAHPEDNPTWRFRRVITVHPLGGCPMADDPALGVVDSRGGVYGQPGLYIADGSVMPGPVGANPSLTIAALADRSADRILEDHASPRAG